MNFSRSVKYLQPSISIAAAEIIPRSRAADCIKTYLEGKAPLLQAIPEIMIMPAAERMIGVNRT